MAKKEPFSRDAPLPPALLRLVAVLMDIARNEAKEPAAGGIGHGGNRETPNAEDPAEG